MALSIEQVRKIDLQLAKRMLLCLSETIDDTLIGAGWPAFLEVIDPRAKNTVIDRAAFEQLFCPWFLFNWIPNHPKLKKRPIARWFLEEGQQTLEEEEQVFIEESLQQPCRLLHVVEIAESSSLEAVDLQKAELFTIKDSTASTQAMLSKVLLARLHRLTDRTILHGMLGYCLPESYVSSLKQQASGWKHCGPAVADREMRRAYLGYVLSLL